MVYDERMRNAQTAHNIIMEGRRKLSASGVEDVESFDENEIVMVTALGVLVLTGKELRIEKLSLDTGDVIVEGAIDKFEYEDIARADGTGFFSRLFK